VRSCDTSGLVPLLAEQEASAELRRLFGRDHDVAAWWGTPVEWASAAARLRRGELFTLNDEDAFLALLARLRTGWPGILPSERLRDGAVRLLRTHSIRAADALQLGAAVNWAGPSRDGAVVTLDERLGLAARIEGFRVLP
jgi:uncharacterized protein